MDSLPISSYPEYFAVTDLRPGETRVIRGERKDCTFLYAGKERDSPPGLVNLNKEQG